MPVERTAWPHRARAIAPVWLVALITVVACRAAAPAAVTPGGDPEAGKIAIMAYGCGACHTVPGVRGANGLVGPPLTRFARRSFIAGEVPNTFENLVRWIEAPQDVEPGTAMPNLGVVAVQARNIAAYLYTLR